MEYVPLGSLKEYLPRHKRETDLSTLLSYSIQICKVTVSIPRAVSSDQLVPSGTSASYIGI